MYTRARARHRCIHGKTRCIVITVTTPHCCRVVSEREIEKERGKVEHKKKTKIEGKQNSCHTDALIHLSMRGAVSTPTEGCICSGYISRTQTINAQTSKKKKSNKIIIIIRDKRQQQPQLKEIKKKHTQNLFDGGGINVLTIKPYTWLNDTHI